MAIAATGRPCGDAANPVDPQPGNDTAPEPYGKAWFASLYEATVPSAYRYALVFTKDPTLAEDAVSEAYLRAWRARRSFNRGSATSWMLAITRNCALDALRKQKRETSVTAPFEAEDVPEEDCGVGEPTLSPEDVARIKDVIQQLTPEQQQVIMLRFYDELPHEQVAERLERSPNAVRAIQFRAIARMRKLLGVTT